MYKNLTNETTSVTQRAELYQKNNRGAVPVFLHFVVQLEIRVNQEWKVAIRYDCAHGYSHVDRYDIMGKQTKRPLNLQFESALTYGDWDINENWPHYRDAFLKGREDERLQ